MFKDISIEHNILPQKKPSLKFLQLLKHNWELGKEEESERRNKFKTNYSIEYNTKPMLDNRFSIGSLPYLKPNFSQVVLFNSRQKEENPYLTVSKRDFSQKMTRNLCERGDYIRSYSQNKQDKEGKEGKEGKSRVFNYSNDLSYKQSSTMKNDYINQVYFMKKTNSQSAAGMKNEYNTYNITSLDKNSYDKWFFSEGNTRKINTKPERIIITKPNYNPILHMFQKNSFWDERNIK